MAFRAKIDWDKNKGILLHCDVIAYIADKENTGSVVKIQSHSDYASSYGSRLDYVQSYELSIPIQALEALDDAVHEISRFMGKKIDLTEDGQKKINEAFEKYPDNTASFAQEVFIGRPPMHN